MKAKKKKSSTWKEVKAVLSGRGKGELMVLVGDLYSLSKENAAFVNARCIDSGVANTRRMTAGVAIKRYCRIISNALYPDIFEKKPIQLAVGKKAISDYYKATKDELGKVELMMHYLEEGGRLTIAYGDYDAPLCNSLLLMLDRLILALQKLSVSVQMQYLERLEQAADEVKNIGWYYDCFCEGMNGYAQCLRG